MAISDEYAADAITFALLLSRYENGLSSTARDHLELLLSDLRALILESGESLVVLETRTVELQMLIARANGLISNALGLAAADMEEALIGLAPVVAEGRVAKWNSILGAPLFSAALSPADLSAIARDGWFVAVPLREWWARQTAKMQRVFADAIRSGVTRSETDADIIKRLIGTRIGTRTVTTESGIKRRVGVYANGVLSDVSRREVAGLVRTAVHGVANQTMAQLYDLNSDILRGRQTVITLDNNTSLLCISRDNASWDMEGNPLPESPWQFQFPGFPPWHWKCRTVIIPILKDFAELSEGMDPLLASRFGPGIRASMNGEIADETTFSAWLAPLSVAEQNQSLGPGRRQLWESGKITLSQLADQAGRTLTLEQLRALTS